MLNKYFFLLLPLLFLTTACEKEAQIDIDIQLIEDYLEANNIEAERTDSGLHYVMEKVGNGNTSPNIYSTVEVIYEGRLLDGTVFDKTPDRTSSLIEMRYAVAGWQEGLSLMKRNGKATLFIPSPLGYRNDDTGIIPANSVLIFDVELIDF